jgi:hypothetical protein
MRSFDFGRVRRWAALVLFAFFATVAASAADSDRRTIFVALDKVAYLSNEADLLKAQVERAIQLQLKPVDVSYFPAEIRLTIHDLERDRAFADNVEKYFANKPAFSVVREPALTIRLSYSEQALKTYHRDRLQRDYTKLADIVMGLRTLPVGVTVESDTDGAILRARDSAFADRLSKSTVLVITPITKTSWRVTWGDDMLAALSPANRIAARRGISELIHFSYGDPAGMRTEQTDDGIALLIPDPAANQAFIDQIKAVFAHDPNFVLTESQALVFHVSEINNGADASSPKASQTLPGMPTPSPISLMKAGQALDEIVNPAVEIVAEHSSVSAHALDQAHDTDRVAALVRHALADRADLIIASRPDQSLLISLAPGAHIIPPRPPLQTDQMSTAVKARLNQLNLRATQISPVGSDGARVQLPTAADAATFRAALSRPSGLTMRLVDDANDNATKPPSPGDERLQLPTKEYIWVNPRAIVTGDMIADAEPSVSKYTESSIIAFRLTEEGRQRFESATRENIGRRFVIAIDGVAVEAPVIQDAILGGSGQIEGGFTAEQAAKLAQSMRGHQNDLPLRVVDSVAR